MVDLAAAAREWLADCQWQDMEPEDINELPEPVLLAAVERHYDGGLLAFTLDFA